MPRRLLLAALATGALALGAPAAVADPPTFDCGFESVEQDGAARPAYEGAAYGYIVDSDSSEPVSIRCYITVDGTDASSTPTGTGTGAATTQGTVSFEATDDQEVLLCAEYSAHGTTYTQCFATEHQELIDDLLWYVQVVTEGLDPIVCDVFQIAGVPTLVNQVANPPLSMDPEDCDLWYANRRLVDFAPYNDPS